MVDQPSKKMQSEIKNLYCTFINVHYIICDCGDTFPTEEELKQHLQTKHDSGNILECTNVPPITITASIEKDIQQNVSTSHEKTGLDVLLDGVDIQCMSENNQPVLKPLNGGKKSKMKTVEVKEEKVEKKEKESVYEIMIRLLGSDFFKPTKSPKLKKKPVEIDKSMVTVTELTVKQAVQELRKRKEKIGYKEAPYHCHLCHRYYHSVQKFHEHMQSHDESHGPHECSVCKIRMKSKWNLNKHMEGLHKRKYSCKICPFTSTHKESVIRHTAFHKGLKHKCPHCSKEFDYASTCELHVRRDHPARYACVYCGYTFISKQGLTMHARMMHSTDGEVVSGPFCNVCKKLFASQEAFDRHLEMSSLHNSGNTLTQPNTPKNVNAIARCVEMQRRIKDRLYPCEECGLELTKRYYIKHFRTAHRGKQSKRFNMKPVQCNLCGKAFNSRPYLYVHMQKHREPRYRCECGKQFHFVNNYKKHRATHLPREMRTTHPCHLCDNTFTEKQNLQRHLAVTHPGLKPFPCDVCGKSYTSKSVLQGHVNHVHLKIPRPPREPRRRRGPGHEISAPAHEILGPEIIRATNDVTRGPDHEITVPDYAITSIDHDMRGRNYEIRATNHATRSPDYQIRATNDGTRGPDHEIRGTNHEMRGANRTEIRRSNHEIRLPNNKIRGQYREVRGTDHEKRGRAHEKRGPDSKKRGPDQGHRPRAHKQSPDQEIQGLVVKRSNSNNMGGPDHQIQGLLVRSSNSNNKGGLDHEIQGFLVKSLDSNNINRGPDHEIRASYHRGPNKDKCPQGVVRNTYNTSLRPQHIQMRDSGHIDMRGYDHIEMLD